MKKTCKYVKIICLCTIFTGMCGCEKVVEFKIDDITPQVVVMSKPVTDSIVSVQLTYSRFFLSNSKFRTVENAGIRLLRNGSALSLLKAEDGCYHFDCRPSAGDSLKLHLDVPGYAHICAATRVPQKPSVEAELIIDTSSNEYAYKCQLRVKIHDPSGENYYGLSVDNWSWFMNGSGDTVYSPETAMLSTNDMVFTDVSSLDYLLDGGETYAYEHRFLFSDELFNGRDYVMNFNFDIYYWPDPSHPLYLKINSLSKDLFRYQRTKESSNNSIDFFTEPVQIYGNIDGGLGIFAASANDKIKLTPIYK